MKPATIERKKDAGKKLVLFTLSLDIRQYAEGEAHNIPNAMHVAPIGKWDHPLYGEFEVTRETVREFIENFEAGIRKAKLPIMAGHDVFEEHAAIGWMVELYEGPRGLYAKVEWTTEGEALLRKGKFKYFSPEWFTSYTDPATGSEHGHVLIGGALTNKPFFRELDDVVAFSEYVIHKQSFTMNLDEIRTKEVADLTDEEKAFLKDNETELSEEEKPSSFMRTMPTMTLATMQAMVPMTLVRATIRTKPAS